MGKKQRKASKYAGFRAFGLLVLIAGLLSAAHLTWEHFHRPAAIPYHETGWMPEHLSDRWKCIVIHHSAGEAGGAMRFDKMHREQRGWESLGYHFVIGNGSDTADGQVEIGPRWVGQMHGAHCKTDDHFYNEHGIGICLVGNFNNHPPTEKQRQSLVRLVRFLSYECKIPPIRIYTHGGVTGKTECPGKMFDVEVVRAAARAE